MGREVVGKWSREAQLRVTKGYENQRSFAGERAIEKAPCRACASNSFDLGKHKSILDSSCLSREVMFTRAVPKVFAELYHCPSRV